MRMTKNMRRLLRLLPCGFDDVPYEERKQLELAGLAYVAFEYEFIPTVELTDAGRRWLDDNPEESK